MPSTSLLHSLQCQSSVDYFVLKLMDANMQCMTNHRVLLVANRLPVSAHLAGGGVRLADASGGLATGLRGYHERADALWIVGGRVVDWARLPGARADVATRTAEALRAAPADGALGGWLPPEELDEVRLVGGWLASHAARVLELRPAPSPARVEAFVAAALV